MQGSRQTIKKDEMTGQTSVTLSSGNCSIPFACLQSDSQTVDDVAQVCIRLTLGNT